MKRISKREIIMVLVFVIIIIAIAGAFSLGWFNINHNSPLDYPDSVWVSSDGKLTLTVGPQSNRIVDPSIDGIDAKPYRINYVEYANLVYDDGTRVAEYQFSHTLGYGHIKVFKGLYNACEWLYENKDSVATWRAHFATKNLMIFKYHGGSEEPPYFGEKVPFYKKYIVFKRVK